MLEFERVFFGYEGQSATLKDLSFAIGEGEFVALLGENGAGKSTLCRLANGLLKPSAGRVLALGMDTKQVKTSLLARDIGFLFQNPDRQICQNSVRAEILFGLEIALADEAARRARCEEMLELFSLSGERDPFGMSRGERQQIALASVLARAPSLLILDEPTTGLDYRECMAIMGIVAQLHQKGTTILMISHDMEIVADFAGRALVLSEGGLIGDGPVRRIMRDEALLGRASLLPAQIPALGARLGGPYAEAFSVEELLSLAVGKKGEKERAEA
ncbi:MAG: energy-coupling factor ABC transporter ATP-binding protein [Christensenellaceae bacterium]|jgi:energy-coupling factor transport system ATP-binding protein|nr:energy-coupling factor ABC transporter ATP-binding protein [Christensenellaceae bacterium]